MPDADNIGKIIMDGMNPKRKLNKQLRKMVEVMQGVYKDDRQVTKLLVVKRYAERPRVEVRIKRDMGDQMKYSAELIAIAGMLICFGAVGLVVFVL